MKVFFTGSPRALEKFSDEYRAIYDAINDLGHQNLSDLVIKAHPDKFYERSHDEIVKHYSNTIRLIKDADVVLAEVSLHSLSMGYIIDRALELSKQVIILHLPQYSPFFLSGLEDERLQILEYGIKNIKTILKDAFDYASQQQDVRFNFFVSPKIQQYLDWVAKFKRTPRAVYLRELLEKDMRENKEWKKQK